MARVDQFDDLVSLAAEVYQTSPSKTQWTSVFQNASLCHPHCFKFSDDLYRQLKGPGTVELVRSVPAQLFQQWVGESLRKTIVASNVSSLSVFPQIVAILDSEFSKAGKIATIESLAEQSDLLATLLAKAAERMVSGSYRSSTSEEEFSSKVCEDVWLLIPRNLKTPNDFRELEQLRKILLFFARWKLTGGTLPVFNKLVEYEVEQMQESPLAQDFLKLSRAENFHPLLSFQSLRESATSAQDSAFIENLIFNANSRRDLITRMVIATQIDLPVEKLALLVAKHRMAPFFREGTSGLSEMMTEVSSSERDKRVKDWLKENLSDF